MICYLTIVRYPKWMSWAGFLSMAIFRFPLWIDRKVNFYKLMGCGKNGTFDKIPDLRQWALLTIQKSAVEQQTSMHPDFIVFWWKIFGCEQWTLTLEPIEGHGTWDGKECFGHLPKQTQYDGVIGILTRATIRLNRLHRFWKHVAGVAKQISAAEGFITSVGIGELPWVKQATFSLWINKESMKSFAYKLQEHAEVIRKTNQEKWYSEDMFIRFKPIASHGSINGINPLEGKL